MGGKKKGKKTGRRLPVMGRLGVAFLTWRRHLQKSVVPLKITLKQIYTLRQLARRDYLHPSELAEMLFCDRPTVSVILRNMKAKGWIRDEEDPENRKMKRVRITAKGRKKLENVGARWPREVTSFDPLACFSRGELAQFEGLLVKLHRHLGRVRG